MKNINRLRLYAATASLAVLAAGLTAPSAANAFSNAVSARLPGTNINVQANAYSDNFGAWNRTFWFQTSSKATQAGRAVAVNSIRNTATVRVTGIAASVSLPAGVTVSGSASEKSMSWQNTNAWISDLAGRASYSAGTWTFKVNSAAFVEHRGVRVYVDAWSW